MNAQCTHIGKCIWDDCRNCQFYVPWIRKRLKFIIGAIDEAEDPSVSDKDQSQQYHDLWKEFRLLSKRLDS